MVELIPVPEVLVPPGCSVKVHIPVSGRPSKTTLPVATVQSGCVIGPTVGSDGVAGCVLMTILADGKEIQPGAFVTVKVYVPEGSPVIVELVPVPEVIIPPGFLVNVQVPSAGRPFNSTLPVATGQEGCVIVPIVGADGVAGCTLIIISTEGIEVQPCEFVTV